MNEKRGKTVVSFFNGISIGRLALTKMGVPIKQYYSIENDPYANAISRTHWNNTELGDVTKINFNDLPKIDIAFCSAPCQDLSFAGKQKGFAEGTRSSLFFKFIEFLDNQEKRFGVRPHFLVEQVRMKKENLEIMEKLLKTKGILINSKFFSAQNRQRLYFSNFEILEYKDKGVLLKDILEESTASCALGIRAKSKCVRVGGNKSPFYSKQEWDSPFIRTDKKLKEKYGWYKAGCLTGGAHSGGNHSDMDLLLFRNMECRRYTVLECERLQTVPDNYTAHGAEVDGSYKKISNSRRYKALGNGWNCETIIHVLKGLIKNL